MAVERTFSIIKPDATRRNLTGAINAVIEKSGLRIVGQKRVRWARAQAEEFYAEHKGRPFYDELVAFMTSVRTLSRFGAAASRMTHNATMIARSRAARQPGFCVCIARRLHANCSWFVWVFSEYFVVIARASW